MRLLPLALVLAVTPVGAAEPAPASPGAPAPRAAPAAALPRAAIEKLEQGNKSFFDHDYRTALFAYMDAAYLAPASAVPRVRLGRTYLALRYPERAMDQAEKALALDPANEDARKLAEEARGGARSGAAAAAPAPLATPAAPRVYKFVPEAQTPPPAVPARPPAPRTASVPRAVAAAPLPVPSAPVSPGGATAPAPAPGAASTPASAAQRYRDGIDLLQKREFEKAASALDDAIAKDPRLAVAYAARASARFGLGKYGDAAEDYKSAIALDAKLGTPLYGLAECYRVQGDRKAAAEMYRRYAESRASDVREDLRAMAAKRAQELK